MPDLAGNPDLDYAQVIFVKATQNSDGRWRFDTTVRHNDQGWDHYADAWQVVDLAGAAVQREQVALQPPLPLEVADAVLVERHTDDG